MRVLSEAAMPADVEDKRNAPAVIVCIEEHEFQTLLEQALASWRTPKWQWSMIALAIIFPLVLTIRTVWNDPAAVGALVLIGSAYLIFSLGMVFGRALRPRPTERQIQTFNRNLLSRGKCTDLIEESRRLADTLARNSPSSDDGSRQGDELVKQFAIVDRTALLRIEQSVGAIVRAPHGELPQQPSVLLRVSSGEREVHAPFVRCAECGTSLASKQITSACESCGSVLCDSCANALAPLLPNARKLTLCKSCKGVSRAE